MAYDHIFMNLLNTANNFGTLSVDEKSMQREWHVLCQGSHLPWANCSPHLEDSTSQFWHSGSGVIHVSDAGFQLCPNHAQLGSCVDYELASPGSPHTVVQEKQSCHMLCGVWHCPEHTQNFVQNTNSPGKRTTVEKLDVALAIEGIIQHHQFTPAIMVDGTPYHDRGAMVTVCGLDTQIYQSPPCLWRTQP